MQPTAFVTVTKYQMSYNLPSGRKSLKSSDTKSKHHFLIDQLGQIKTIIKVWRFVYHRIIWLLSIMLTHTPMRKHVGVSRWTQSVI